MTNGFTTSQFKQTILFGNIGASQPVNFSLAFTSMAKQASFLAVTVGVVFCAITVFGVAGLLIYLRKRKSQALG